MIFCVLCCAIMFLRSTIRRKDGKEHRYWSIVENRRLRDGRVVQRAVLYLGEINSSQERAWRRSIEVLDETAPAEPQTIALFPEDRCEAAAADQAVVRLHAAHALTSRASPCLRMVLSYRDTGRVPKCHLSQARQGLGSSLPPAIPHRGYHRDAGALYRSDGRVSLPRY